jgi:hypothetical protein
MIQSVVNRLAGNSFTLKSWSITIVSALFALAVKDANGCYAAVALFPALCFWGLDAYYLHQERLFRALHDAVARDMAKPGVQPSIPLFSLTTGPVTDKVDSWFRTLWSRTVFPLHGSILAVASLALALYAKTH